jgi:predicted membrane-bound spermidine synthase
MKLDVSKLDVLAPYLIVFAASACGLILEIVAGRILAPVIGVSLFTWTSIIGVVLAGISIGNFLGGLAADRYPSRTTLGFILLGAGIFTVIILPLIAVVGSAFVALPIILRIVLLTGVLFLPVSLILGMVTPVVIKLHLKDIANTGNVVGRFYAVSTAGSILGVFITGFVLIQWIGTRPIVLAVAVFLFGMALVFGDLWKLRLKTPAILTVIAIVAGAILSSGSYAFGWLDSGCQVESNYFCIRVKVRDIDGHEVRVLTLDQLVHSYVAKDDPAFLVYGYEKVIADFVALQRQRSDRLTTLFIGGGGYTMPRLIEETYPGSDIEVIEIDPAVTEVAHAYLWLPRDTSIVSYNEDARMKMPDLAEGRYDMIVGDAFNDFSVPYHLTTREFNELVQGLLKPGGVFIVNIVDNINTGRFLRAYVYTLSQTFENVYVLRDDDLWEDDPRSNITYVVVATDVPVTPDDLAGASASVGRAAPVTRFMPPAVFERWSSGEEKILLTDGFVPVDQLIAPLYLKSR